MIKLNVITKEKISFKILGYSQLRNVADLQFSWLDEIISALKWGKAEASLDLATNPTQVTFRKREYQGLSFPSDRSAFLPYSLNTRLTPRPAQLKWHTKSLQIGCLLQPFSAIPVYQVISSFFFFFFPNTGYEPASIHRRHKFSKPKCKTPWAAWLSALLTKPWRKLSQIVPFINFPGRYKMLRLTSKQCAS